MNKKSKVIWLLFLSSIIIVIIDAIFIVSNSDCPALFNRVKLYFPVLVVFSHIFATLDFKRGFFFILLSSFAGLFFEFIGTRYGDLINAGYAYDKTCYDILFFDVPLLIPLYWTIFIYTAYSITNSFLYWKNKDKPSINTAQFKTLIKIILFDSLLVLSIDIFMEPILVHAGNWQWFGSGFYFNIPSMNFMGWFTVAFIVSAIFRIFEYNYPRKKQILHHSIFLIPLFGYSSLYLIFLVMAFEINYYFLIVLNTTTMLSVIILNIHSYLRYIKNKKGQSIED